MTQRRIGVSQEFPREQKRLLRAERFEREVERSRTDKDVLQVAIRRDTALAWLDRHYASLSGAIIAGQAEWARLELQAAEAAYRAGRGSQADVISARAELVMLDDRTSEVVRRGRGAQAALSRWVGDAAEWPLQGQPAIDTIALAPGNLEAQLAQHPQIAAIARQEAIVATEVKLARANRTPDWSAELSYSQRGPAYSNMISFGVSIPLQWDRSNRQDRELASRLAMLDQARAQRQDALRAYVAEVRKLIADWEVGRERRARYERELIPLAVQRSQALLAAYRGGKTSLAEVLASRRSEIDLRLQALQIEAETAQAWARLNFLANQSGVIGSAKQPIKETE
jgi:outer membrane protein TolC